MGKLFACAVMALCGLLIIGCSGGNSAMSANGQGDMRLTIVWPELDKADSRYIPRATQSIVITIDDGAGFTANQTIPRPADGSNTTVTFPDVPTGDVAIMVVAYPNADGTGTPLATATAVATITNRGTTTVTIDLNSTITEVIIDQYPTDINATETSQLVATARDADGDVVPTLPAPDDFHWTSSDDAIATVDQHGLLTAHAAGTVTIAAMERETGISGQVTVQINPATGTLEIIIVNDPISVTVTPSTVALSPGATQQFTAAVSGVPNQHVVWTVEEANGGTISRDGVYTAPAGHGVFHVRATSIADDSESAVAEVTVGPTGKIAFMSYRSGNPDIFIMDSDGSNVTQLTFDTRDDDNPCISPDGTKIAFTSNRNDSNGNPDVFLMDIDGSNQTPLTTGGGNFFPSFSPDGSKIVYCSYIDGNYDVYVMDADGGNTTRITQTPAYEWNPTFSPDGTKIVYKRYYQGSDEIYLMHADGTNPVALTNNGASNDRPRFSPDGSHIVFTSSYNRPTGRYGIHRINLDGSGWTCLSLTDDSDVQPCYNADGSKIAFLSMRSGYLHVSTMNPDGTGVTQLTFGNDHDYYPFWWGN